MDTLTQIMIWLSGTFTVTFRTGERTRGRGFELYIICYEPLDLDLPGRDSPVTDTIHKHMKDPTPSKIDRHHLILRT